jgi:hypothetical protein
MNPRRISLFQGTVCLAALLAAGRAAAQAGSERLAAAEARLQTVRAVYERLPALHQQIVDGNRNAVHLADVWSRLAPSLNRPRIARPRGRPSEPSAGALTPPFGILPVTDPSGDLDFSAFGGFTQSETHSAWCGSNVVVGFNDSGSFLETASNGLGGFGFSGVAFSTDQGSTFRDVGPVNPGPDPATLLLGDPAVACSDPRTFYFSQIALAGSQEAPVAGIAFSKSVDGGADWGDPITVVAKDGSAHILDKPWMAVDPANPRRIVITYTDFDLTGARPCLNDARTAIEFVSSVDNGAHWTLPFVVDQVCGFANALQGSQVVLGATPQANATGTPVRTQINFAWEAFSNYPIGPRELRTRSFNFYNRTFSPVVVVDKMVGGGDSFLLQGGFRDFLGLSMAVDRSGGPTNGALYVAWDDGRNKTVTDLLSQTGSYSYDDVLVRSSFDGGVNWGFAPTRVNSDVQPRFALGHDHYQPGIAVDRTAKVAVCWYDRRGDAENFAISRYCGSSTDAGLTWKNTRVNVPAFAPVHGIDQLLNPLYMGDYDGLTTDFLRLSPGFLGAFQFMGSTANPDVVSTKFQ